MKQGDVEMAQHKIRHPNNLLETPVGQEVSELLGHSSLELSSGHQAWLLMAILYLVERERQVAVEEWQCSATRRPERGHLLAVGQ